MESARMVSSLMQAGSVRPAIQAPDTGAADVYDRQLSCQIWSLEGDLIGRSQSAPAERLSEGADGFSERTIRGERWRVYTVHDRDAGFRVMVGDNLAVREHLVGNVVTALIGPAVLGLLALGVLIWWSVGRGLAPIRQMTRSLAVRDAEDLTALDVSPDARELRPFALALNDLMSRLAQRGVARPNSQPPPRTSCVRLWQACASRRRLRRRLRTLPFEAARWSKSRLPSIAPPASSQDCSPSRAKTTCRSV